MEQKLEDRISYDESPTFAIARILRAKGYLIANPFSQIFGVAPYGRRVSEPPHDGLGILEPRNPIQRSFLGLKWNKAQRALYIGTLWVDNDEDDEAIGAKHNENWVLEVYGRENVSKLTELIKELPKPENVSVQVRLTRETPLVEYISSDSDAL